MIGEILPDSGFAGRVGVVYGGTTIEVRGECWGGESGAILGIGGKLDAHAA